MLYDAPSGVYQAVVTRVDANNLVWVTPANSTAPTGMVTQPLLALDSASFRPGDSVLVAPLVNVATGQWVILGTIGAKSLLPGGGSVRGWTTATLASGWSPGASGGNTPQYTREDDKVWIRGWVQGGTNNTTVFTLPAGYRPTQLMNFPVTEVGGLTQYLAAVNTNGAVVLWGAGESGAFPNTSLDGISFFVT